MGRTFDKRVILRLLEVFVFQVWLQLLNPREVVSQQKQVLQHCNLSTKAAVLLPFNEQYSDQEALQGKLKVIMSDIDFAPGIHDEPSGAITLKGEHNSYVEIAADEQIDIRHSITILSHIYPFESVTGPIVHYNADGNGVQMWIVGTPNEKARLMARFNKRNVSTLSTWLQALVLNLGQWNFIGASYNHVTGDASLYHDGVKVQSITMSKNMDLATKHNIRIGAVTNPKRGKFKGRFACLQLYSKALQIHEVVAARDACMPVVPLQFLSLNLTSPLHVAEVNETMLTVRASSNDNATKPTFRFYWGDGAVTQENFSNTAYHMYHFIGIYTLHVQAWSPCNTSTLSENANISVPTPVRILKNISLQGEATALGAGYVYLPLVLISSLCCLRLL